MDPKLCSVRYASFDAAVNTVRELGSTAASIARCDRESAIRFLPAHPADCDLLGFRFDGFSLDMSIPMRWSISCAAFEHFSTFFQ